MSRQGEMKSGSSFTISGGAQLPAMRLHNGTADGQPHAAALRLGGKERRKELIIFSFERPMPVSTTEKRL
jgi:hypothetical protein